MFDTQPARIRKLNSASIRSGRYVLYWMQQSQRAQWNHALTRSIERANELHQSVVVGFGITEDYPDANLRHYQFMLEGLREVEESLRNRGIQFVLRIGQPSDVALELAGEASCIVCDRGYTRHQKTWRNTVAEKSHCLVEEVESDIVVPLHAVTGKREYAARTIRPKIHRLLPEYLCKFQEIEPRLSSLGIPMECIDISDIPDVLKRLSLDKSVSGVDSHFTGGTSQAMKRFDTFIDCCFQRYDDHSNQPQTDDCSHMSPYLHFGQISPLYLSYRVMELDPADTANRDAYIEELIVRRELAMNFVEFTDDYDSFSCLPDWCKKTLSEHGGDQREYLYTMQQLESADTHDPYWNAAMKEMICTGFMHNYMRMYWGKKILEWTSSPEDAYATILHLNNKYFLDGRDPNSYTGVAWIFGLHDRAWSERPIFGKVRYMAASGLERKCDISGYVEKVKRLCRRSQ